MADYSSIDPKECKRESLPRGVGLTSARTVILQSVLNNIKNHGRSSLREEVCGVLVGNLCVDRKKGSFLKIIGWIEGRYAEHQAGNVTFKSETWDFIHLELSAKYPESQIVGWYHTHPGFGIFLSAMDVFIHTNFFNFPWQPAYVFDPQAETDGFFFADGDKLIQESVSVIEDEAASVSKPVSPEDIEASYTGATVSLPAAKRILRAVCVMLTLFLIGGTCVTFMVLYDKNNALTTQLSNALARISTQESDHGSQAHRLQEQQRLIETLTTENRSHKKLIHKSGQDLELFRSRQENATKENERLLKECDALSSQVTILQSDLSGAVVERNAMQKERDALIAHKEALAKEIERLKDIAAVKRKDDVGKVSTNRAEPELSISSEPKEKTRRRWFFFGRQRNKD